MSDRARSEIIIGVDAGTSGVKVSAFAPGSSWRRTCLREYPLLKPEPGRFVQDPDAILRATGEALADCVAGIGSAEVIAVSVSAGMHALLGLDRDGRPVTGLVIWADARAVDEARDLHGSGEAAALHELSGTPVHPMSPLTKLRWFVHHEPETVARARWWIDLKALLLQWLTGTLVTELSSASGSGLLDMSTRSWSPRALDVAGISADRLPPIEPTTAVRPLAAATAERVGLPAGTPVVLGAADGPLGNLGTGALAPGVAGLSLGTSGAVRVLVDEPRVDADHTLFCYALTESAWVLGGAISNGGSVVRWAGDTFLGSGSTGEPTGQGDVDDALIELAATAPAGCDGLVMLPYLLPPRAPLWDADLSGAYLGVRREHGRAHFARAAIEGVCLQMRLIADALDRVQPLTTVQATGGAFRSALWRDVMAAMIGRPLRLTDGADGTALGAAALGLYALDRAPTLADAAAQLGVSSDDPPPPIPVDAGWSATYEGLGIRVADLIAQTDAAVRATGRFGR